VSTGELSPSAILRIYVWLKIAVHRQRDDSALGIQRQHSTRESFSVYQTAHVQHHVLTPQTHALMVSSQLQTGRMLVLSPGS
jgi:hypothetical protein